MENGMTTIVAEKSFPKFDRDLGFIRKAELVSEFCTYGTVTLSVAACAAIVYTPLFAPPIALAAVVGAIVGFRKMVAARRARAVVSEAWRKFYPAGPYTTAGGESVSIDSFDYRDGATADVVFEDGRRTNLPVSALRAKGGEYLVAAPRNWASPAMDTVHRRWAALPWRTDDGRTGIVRNVYNSGSDDYTVTYVELFFHDGTVDRFDVRLLTPAPRTGTPSEWKDLRLLLENAARYEIEDWQANVEAALDIVDRLRPQADTGVTRP
jgi:hypothetical protein